MVAYVSSGPRDFGDHPLAPAVRPHWEFYAVRRGRLAPLLERGPAQTPSPATLWVLRPGFPHGWTGVSGERASVAVFHYSHVPPALAAATETTGFHCVRLDRAGVSRVARLARELQPRWWNRDAWLELHAERVLMELSILLLEGPAAGKPERARAPSASTALRVRAAENWLRGHFHENPGVRDIARLVGVSSAHLRRLFADELGCTPKEWMLQVQLQVAADLLARSDRKLEAVAAESGFASCSTLCHAFRAACGITPTEWRGAFGENRASTGARRDGGHPPR